MDYDHKQAIAGVLSELGLYLIKVLITLNSGAVIVLLTFVGNIDNSETVVFDIPYLKLSMFVFLAGLAMAFLQILITFMDAQIKFAEMSEVLEAKVQKNIFRRHIVKLVGPSTISFCCFVTGVSLAIAGISAP
jgi:hypothetical protein